MRRFFFHSLIVIGAALAYSCSPTTQPSASTTRYEEDLSALRPEVPTTVGANVEEVEPTVNQEIQYVEPTNHLLAEIDSVIRIKAAKNQEVGYLPGFTIQIYSGRSREDANNAKYAVYDILEDEEATVFYDQPRFRVKVGQYYSRLEAEKSLNLLKKTFRQALILPERIPLGE